MAGRPAAPTQIVNAVIPAAQLTGVDVTSRDLYGVMRDQKEWLQWLARHRLIEGLWKLAKRKLRYQSGTSRGLFASYLTAFQWRNCHKHNVFSNYLQLKLI
jgi:hypothetical protein